MKYCTREYKTSCEITPFRLDSNELFHPCNKSVKMLLCKYRAQVKQNILLHVAAIVYQTQYQEFPSRYEKCVVR